MTKSGLKSLRRIHKEFVAVRIDVPFAELGHP